METPEKSTVSASAEDIRYMQAALREAEEAAAEGNSNIFTGDLQKNVAFLRELCYRIE